MIIQLNSLQSLKIESLNLTASLCDLDSPRFLSTKNSMKPTTQTLMLTSIFIIKTANWAEPTCNMRNCLGTILSSIVPWLLSSTACFAHLVLALNLLQFIQRLTPFNLLSCCHKTCTNNLPLDNSFIVYLRL